MRSGRSPSASGGFERAPGSSSAASALRATGALPRLRRRLSPALLRFLPPALLVLGMSVGATGCTARLTEPPEPSSPVPAFLLDHGRHASVVLPGADSGTVRYSFGDWRYYAEGETGLGSGAKALFWPTPSALGRRELAAEPREAAVLRALRVGTEAVLTLQVEEARARAFRTRLDSLFLDGQEEAFRYNADYDLEFVRHPATYWFGHNSNHVLAEWLRELGVSVRGLTMFSSWKLEPRQAPAHQPNG